MVSAAHSFVSGQWVFNPPANDFVWYPEGVVLPVAPEGVRSFSPTEITKGFECLRLWGFEYLENIKLPRAESARLGTEVHAQLERWFRTGILPDPETKAGQIAEKGLHFWPAPQLIDPQHIESQITFLLGGFWFKGIKDIGFHGAVRFVLGDHKTTVDFKWAKSALDLRGLGEPVNGVQSNIYAAGEMLRSGVTELEAQWVYYRTKKPYKAFRVVEEDGTPVVLTQSSVIESFVTCILPKVRELSGYIEANHRLELSAWDLPPTTSRCDAYGGCPHREHCDLDPIERLVGLMTQESALADRLRARVQAEGLNPPPSTGQPTGPVLSPQPPPPPANNLQPSLPGYAPPPPVAYQPPPPPPPVAYQPPPAGAVAGAMAHVAAAYPPPPPPAAPDPFDGLAAATASSAPEEDEASPSTDSLFVLSVLERAQSYLTLALSGASSDKNLSAAVTAAREAVMKAVALAGPVSR